MEYCWLNNSLISKSEAKISPDDRGFLFADGIYEVVHWYGKFFLDMEAHLHRLQRSLNETRILWEDSFRFPEICQRLLEANSLGSGQALVYLQVTRGSALRTHHFPPGNVRPTVYGFARSFSPEKISQEQGVKVLLKPDIRWLRCDIKSVALLPNVLNFQEAKEQNMAECVFARDGNITEASHSNIFFVKRNELFTHPANNLILPGITRGIVLRMAEENGIIVNSESIHIDDLIHCDEAFIASTSAEITPVISMNNNVIGSGVPGTVTRKLQGIFKELIARGGKF